jgi:hypothetical protein
MPVNKIRRIGSYAPLSAHYYKDDAIAVAGEDAELLFVRGLAFCADVLNDGFITETQLSRFVGVGMRSVSRRAQRLVEVGLWSKVDGGYRVIAWLKWNRSRDDISQLNQKDAGRKGNQGREAEPEPPDNDPESERNPNGSDQSNGDVSERNPNGIHPRARNTDQLHINSTTEPRQNKDLAIAAATAVRVPDLFDEFWSAYPRKVGKADARKAWPRAVKHLDAERLVKAARWWSEQWEAAGVEKRYVLHPTTWLNGQRWNDEPPAPRRQTSRFESQTDANIVAFLGRTGTDNNVLQLPRGGS